LDETECALFFLALAVIAMSVAIVTNPLQQMSGVMLLGEGEALSAIIVAQRSRKMIFLMTRVSLV